MQTVYAIALGDMWQSALNGIVTILANPSWGTALSIMGVLATLSGVLTYVQQRNPMTFLTYGVLFVFINSVLLIPRQSVAIKDITRPEGVYQVDNVPSGLVTIASLSTSLGYLLTDIFEQSLARPDNVTYTKTGMLFGSELFNKASDAKTLDPDLQEFLPKYFESCVEPDINVSHKYTMSDLVNSNDIYALILASPSQIRGFYALNLDETLASGVKNSPKFFTCKAAATFIKTKMGNDTKTGGKTWTWYVNKIFNNRPSGNALLNTHMASSYNYFYGSGQTTTQILRQNVMMNSVKSGMKSFSSVSDGSSDTLNLINSTSEMKMRLSWASMGKLAARWLPIMQSVLMLILVLCFPLVLAIATISHRTYGFTTLLTYGKSFIYLQTWPLMFAIINFCSTYYIKANNTGGALTLAESDQLALLHSDVQVVAGYLCIMVPYFAHIITKGTTAMMSHGVGGLTSSMGSTSSQQASTGADNNWSFNNMSHDNVNANKFDDNSVYKSGMSSRQLANGSMATTTADGGHVYDTSSAMSKLPIDLGWNKSVSSAINSQAKEAYSTSQSMLAGANSSLMSGLSKLSQFSNQRGNNTSVGENYDDSTSSNVIKAYSKMQNSIDAWAESRHISKDQAASELMAKSADASVSAGVGVKFDTDRSIVGKVVGVTTGISGNASADAQIKGTDTDSHSLVTNNRKSEDNSNTKSAQIIKDFKEGFDTVKSSKTSNNGSDTQSDGSSLINQIASDFKESESKYSQYTDSSNRAHELSEMATRTENMSGDQKEGLNQQFVEYVHQRFNDADAKEILTNTSSSSVAEERREIADDFINERVVKDIDGNFDNNKNNLGLKLPEVSDRTGVDVNAFKENNDKRIPSPEVPEKGEVQEKYKTEHARIEKLHNSSKPAPDVDDDQKELKEKFKEKNKITGKVLSEEEDSQKITYIDNDTKEKIKGFTDDSK